MKILLLILMLFGLSGCKANVNINESIYVASIGMAYKDNEYIGYFYIPKSETVGSSDDNKKSSLAKVKAKNLAQVFQKLDNTSSLKLNLLHISSFIIDTSLANHLEELVYFIKNSKDFDYNFYILSANNIESIYKVDNPGSSGLLSPIIEPIVSKYTFKAAHPLHFLLFSKMLLNKMVIAIPYIDTLDIWNNENKTFISNSVAYIGNKIEVVNDFRAEMLCDNDFNIFYIDNKYYELYDYHVKVSYGDNVNIKIEYDYFKDKPLDKKLKEMIIDYINNSKMDILNKEYYKIKNDIINIEIKSHLLKH